MKRVAAKLEGLVRGGLNVSIVLTDDFVELPKHSKVPKVEYEITLKGFSLASHRVLAVDLPATLADSLKEIIGNLQDGEIDEVIEEIRRCPVK